MCITEYDEAKTLLMQYNEGRAEGIAEGMEKGVEKGTLKTLWSLVCDGILPLEAAAERIHMTPEEFQGRIASLQQ